MPAHERYLRLVHSRPANAADMESAVSASLHRARGLDASYIFVSARDGDIILAGWVPHIDQIDRATGVAQGVDGVRYVFNELSSSP